MPTQLKARERQDQNHPSAQIYTCQGWGKALFLEQNKALHSYDSGEKRHTIANQNNWGDEGSSMQLLEAGFSQNTFSFWSE